MKQGIHLYLCVAKLRKMHKTNNVLLRYFHEKQTNNHLQVNPPLQGDRTKRQIQSMSLCHIDNVTESLDANRIERDIWLKRDTDPWNVEYIFGLKEDELSSYIGRESELIGKTGKEQAFLSCGSCEKAKFGRATVGYKIYCPKGTPAFYGEPFSAYGGEVMADNIEEFGLNPTLQFSPLSPTISAI